MTAPTRLFGLDERTDHMDADRPVRRHWCASPECGRCDEIAEIEAEVAKECPRCDGTGFFMWPCAGRWFRIDCDICYGSGVMP